MYEKKRLLNKESGKEIEQGPFAKQFRTIRKRFGP